MVEVRHCDACGRRLPVEFPPNQERVCPGCGAAVEEKAPAVSSGTYAPAAKARAEGRRVLGPRPRTPGSGRSRSSRATAFRPGAGPSDSSRMPAARRRGPSALVIFGGSMAAGLGLAVAAAVMLTGDGPRRSRPASTDHHASATVPSRRSAAPAPAADAPPETTDAAEQESTAGVASAPVPTPPRSPQAAAPARAADAPRATPAFAPAARDRRAEDEFFAKLRRESEERHARAARMKPVIEKNAEWNYLAGAHPRGDWTRHDCGPLGWKAGPAGFGYGDNDDRTVLKDMRHKYTVIYIRRTFDVADPAAVKALELVVSYDDGFIAYLNGSEVARAGVKSGCGTKATGVVLHEAGRFERFDIKEPGRFLREGTNVLAIEGHNVHDRSSDLTLDPYLEGVIESASP